MEILPKRRSIRLKDFDYSGKGLYFISICTQNRVCLFGEINNGKMTLNDMGKMINKWWLKIPQRFINIALDQYQIMPNHFHGVVEIKNNPVNVGVGFPDPPKSIGLLNPNNGRGNPAPTVGQMVGYFKYQSTKQINMLHKTPGIRLWQRNYYEHVIRTETDLEKIREYIKTNPKMWDRDRNNPKNLKD